MFCIISVSLILIVTLLRSIFSNPYYNKTKIFLKNTRYFSSSYKTASLKVLNVKVGMANFIHAAFPKKIQEGRVKMI